jgi:hypothetical protein
MTKPTLFLDIDGVLHPQDAASLSAENKVYGERLFRWLPKLFEALEPHPEVQVVLHSTWRYIWETDEELRSQIPPELSAIIVATTGRDIMGRYDSIEDYCETNNITKFVIVDDDGGAFPYGLPNMVYCMSTQGLSRQNTFRTLQNKLKEMCGEKTTQNNPKENS